MQSMCSKSFFIFLFLILKSSFAMQIEETESDYSIEDLVQSNKCINYLKETWQENSESFLSGLLAGSIMGTIVWGGLSLKDYYFGILLKGGPEFEAMSLSGFILPVGLTAMTTAILATKLEVNFNEAFKMLWKKCNKEDHSNNF
jgi:hypothetical protein